MPLHLYLPVHHCLIYLRPLRAAFGSSRCTRVWQGLIEGHRLGRVQADHCSAKLKVSLVDYSHSVHILVTHHTAHGSSAAGAGVGRVAPAVRGSDGFMEGAFRGEGGGSMLEVREEVVLQQAMETQFLRARTTGSIHLNG